MNFNTHSKTPNERKEGAKGKCNDNRRNFVLVLCVSARVICLLPLYGSCYKQTMCMHIVHASKLNSDDFGRIFFAPYFRLLGILLVY